MHVVKYATQIENNVLYHLDNSYVNPIFGVFHRLGLILNRVEWKGVFDVIDSCLDRQRSSTCLHHRLSITRYVGTILHVFSQQTVVKKVFNESIRVYDSSLVSKYLLPFSLEFSHNAWSFNLAISDPYV